MSGWSRRRRSRAVPSAIVQSDGLEAVLEDARIDVIAIGPGLGRGDEAERRLDMVRAAGRRLVLDADALWRLGHDPARLPGSILTPHEGEFARLFGDLPGSKVERARAAAARCGCRRSSTKAPDTVVAAPDGRAAIAPPAPAWLATAGTGDVLTGIVAARYAAVGDPFQAACEAVWLHGRAAERAGPGLIADDLARRAVSETIIRLAARGDGVTESGRCVAMAAPGDMIAEDGQLSPGPHHAVPPCRHFPECGGCQLQHVDDAAYADYLKDRIASALAAQGVTAAGASRAASLAAVQPPPGDAEGGGAALLGFNAEASHRIVDMRECHILRPELFALVAPLRRLLNGRASAAMTLADQGVDLLLEGVSADGLEAAEALTAFARENRLARLALDDGYGAADGLGARAGDGHARAARRSRCRPAPSCRRRRTARRPWSPRFERRWAARRSSPICSRGSALSRWRWTARSMRPKPRGTPCWR